MTSGLYTITNIVNSKRYVGSSINIEKRWSSHRCRLNRGDHDNGHLQNAWDKYGAENFEFKILAITDPENTLVLEDYVLKHYIERFEYNIATDATAPMYGRTGENNPNWGSKRTPEQCAKISSNHADVSGENNPMFGKHRSKETKAKISAARTGKYTGKNNPNWGNTGKNNPRWIDIPEETLAAMQELRAEGCSYRQIAGAARLCFSTVRNRLTNITKMEERSRENTRFGT